MKESGVSRVSRTRPRMASVRRRRRGRRVSASRAVEVWVAIWAIFPQIKWSPDVRLKWPPPGRAPAGGHLFMKRVLVLVLMLGAVSAAVLTAQTKPAAGDDAVMKA